MFAPLTVSSKTALSRTETSFPPPPARTARNPSSSGQTAPSWDFGQVPLFQRNGAPDIGDSSGSARGLQIVDQSQPVAAPAASLPAAPAVPLNVPTVNRIDLVNSAAGAIKGFHAVELADLNKPGPFNDPKTKGVAHALQVHFHLDKGKSSALSARREIQRTYTVAGFTHKNPPDRPAADGGSPESGGFEGVASRPDGPGTHETLRPSADKIVVADAPSLGPAREKPDPLPADQFPLIFKAHFTVTLAAGATDVARVEYDVLINKASPDNVPNVENRSFVTRKEDLVRSICPA